LPSDKEAIYNELLVLRCQRGDKVAWEELVHNWQDRLFYYIRRLVDDEQEAWQVLQEVWLKVLGGIEKLQDPNRLAGWLYAITRNTALSHLRNDYARKAMIEDVEILTGNADEDETFQFDNAEQVHYALGKIKLDHREVLTLFFLQDLSIKEIAQVLGIAIGTVKSRLYYAKKTLKEILERQGG